MQRSGLFSIVNFNLLNCSSKKLLTSALRIFEIEMLPVISHQKNHRGVQYYREIIDEIIVYGDILFGKRIWRSQIRPNDLQT